MLARRQIFLPEPSNPDARYLAPAVRYPLRRSMQLLCILVLPGALSSCVFAAFLWHAQAAFDAVRFRAGIALWLSAIALMACAIWRWRRQPEGELDWRLGEWTLVLPQFPSSSGNPMPEKLVELDVVLDVQFAMLLRARGQNSRRGMVWLWLEKQWSPSRWPDLRRAVYSS